MITHFEGISINPNIRFNKPCVEGTRITAAEVLHWLSLGMSSDEIIADYPYLSKLKIQQVLAYAAVKEARHLIELKPSPKV